MRPSVHLYRGMLGLVANASRLADEEGNTSSRPLGLLVARGTLLTTIAPVDGSEEIANPFLEDEEEQVQLG